ncbi:hypothetical protein HGM15179_019075 [Zosterops borbonicus]|uniref:Uncharacterized protein n=1 Tax=Zosterops borbonicus TaxID=364589 RepID=A0A8K1FXT4_9PASS|nr:hypothetical protein HGM15179_019075 [Zosterops borbonicus]
MPLALLSCCCPAPRDPFLPRHFPATVPQPVALPGVVVTQGQDLELGLIEPQTTGLDPLIQPVQIPLQRLPALQQINCPAQRSVIHELTEDVLVPLVQIINKAGLDWSQY